MNSTIKALAFGAAVSLAVFEAGSLMSGHAPASGHAGSMDMFGSLLRQVLPSMRLDPNVKDAIDDRRGESASWPGGYGRGEPPITDNPTGPGDDGYQGRQGSEPPPMPPPPCPPGLSGRRRPPPGGPVNDDSDWWDDQHFRPERGQGRWRDCGPSGRRCGPGRDGPMPGDAIHEDERWRR